MYIQVQRLSRKGVGYKHIRNGKHLIIEMKIQSERLTKVRAVFIDGMEVATPCEHI